MTIRPLNGNTALGYGILNNYTRDSYMMSSCLGNNTSSCCITALVYDMNSLIDNDMHMERSRCVELGQGIKVLRGIQQWMSGENRHAHSPTKCASLNILIAIPHRAG